MNANKHNTLTDVLQDHIDNNLYGIIFIKGKNNHKFVTYNEVYMRSLKILYNLQQYGIRDHDELVILLNDDEEFIYTFWACILGKIIPVPLSVGFTDENRNKILNVLRILNSPFLAADSSVLKTLDDFSAKYSRQDDYDRVRGRKLLVNNFLESDQSGYIKNTSPGDLAMVQFSSGSTGVPKGVALTHKNLVTNIKAIGARIKTRQDDKYVSWMPLTHDMGLIAAHMLPLVTNFTQIKLPVSLFIRKPLLWLKIISKYKATLSCSPNFGYKYVLSLFNPETAGNLDLSNLRLILNGAEPISPVLCYQFCDMLKKYNLSPGVIYPAYGLAEASVCVSIPDLNHHIKVYNLNRSHLVFGKKIRETDDENGVKFVEVGYAVNNCAIRICDNGNNVLGDNRIGNIQIKGENVTSGYYNNEVDSKCVISESGWLNTGDAGFIREGKLVITGRIKDIIFSKGLNIYSHDIERVVEEYGKVNTEYAKILVSGRVIASGVYNEELGEDEIIIFVTYKKMNYKWFSRMAFLLRKFINIKTGIYCRHIVPVPFIPKTTSGKVKRYRIMEDYIHGVFDEKLKNLQECIDNDTMVNIVTDYQTDVGKKLAAIWREVLHTGSASPTDNFFECGGDSLKASILISKINSEFGVALKAEDVFNFPDMAKLKNCLMKIGGTIVPSLKKAAPGELYSLSPAQERMFLLYKLQPHNTAYNVPVVLKIREVLDLQKMEKSFNTLCIRHEILRTVFCIKNGQPAQRVNDEVDINIDFIVHHHDLLLFDPDFFLRDFIQPFDLFSGRALFRIGVVYLPGKQSLLLIDMHHIICDGYSILMMVDELMKIYYGLDLSPVKFQYKDYCEWYREAVLTAPGIKEQAFYWKEKFNTEPPILNMPVDFQRLPDRNYEGDHLHFRIDQNDEAQLFAIAQEHNATLYMVLLSFFNILLFKYTEQNDIIVGSPVFTRPHSDLSGVAGLFINTLCMRNFPDNDKTFISFLHEVKSCCLQAFENREYQYDELVSTLNIKRELSRNPIFDVMFSFLENKEILNAEMIPVGSKNSMFDITLSSYKCSLGIEFILEFSAELFTRESMLRFIKHFKNIIKAIVRNPRMKLSTIDYMTPVERRRILFDFAGKKVDYPRDKTFHAVFEECVLKCPDNIAVVYGENQITYNTLNMMANNLAFILLKEEADIEDVVAVMIDRSIDMIVSILGILKAGCAYLPLSPTLPAQRVEYMLSDSNSRLLLTRKKFNIELSTTSKIIYIEDIFREIQNEVNLYIPVSADNLMYVLYTSGTSGIPKAVQVHHRAFLNIAYGWQKEYCLSEFNVNLLQLADFTFDVSAGDLGRTFLNCGKLVICPGEVKLNFSALYRLICRERITIFESTPALVESFMNYIILNELSFESLKILILGSDVCRASYFNKIKSYLSPSIRVINSYGVTEATIDSSYYGDDLVDIPLSGIVPVGKPFPNIYFLIMNKNDNLLPVNVVGELFIGGESLSKGYRNRPGLTKEKFIENPFFPGKYLYKTGDLARWLPDGNVEFLGRRDYQIKIRGYRIDPGEIEDAIKEYLDITDVLVISRKSPSGDKQLVAYMAVDFLIHCDDLKSFIEIKDTNEFRFDFRINYKLPCNVIFGENLSLHANIHNISYGGVGLVFMRMDLLQAIFKIKCPLGRKIDIIPDFYKKKNIRISGVIVRYAGEFVGVKFFDKRNPIVHREIDRYIQFKELRVKDLRRYLLNKLPHYMVPSFFIKIDTIPLTPNGKIDKNALPEPAESLLKSSSYAAPTTDTEKILTGSWQKILGISQVGIYDNFFEIGGDSLKALMIINELITRFHITIRDIFKYQTIAELGRILPGR